LIHTGGTINSHAERAHVIGRTSSIIVESDRAANVLRESYCRAFPDLALEVTFSESTAMSVASENMTPLNWSILLRHIKSLAKQDIDGLIITHGTDTLAYTACLLSLMLDNISIPVAMVAANKPLTAPDSNGFTNFNAATNLIVRGLRPGVYVVYRNSDGKTYLHHGAEILQCAPFSDDFFSLFQGGTAGSPIGALPKYMCDPTTPDDDAASCALDPIYPLFTSVAGNRDRTNAHKSGNTGIDDCRISFFKGSFAKVIAVNPYVGLDYASVNIDGAAAVVHNLYHSSTAATSVLPAGNEYSILSLNDRCKERGLPLFIGPIRTDNPRHFYASTALMLKEGIIPVYAKTFEMAYVRTLVKLSVK
jgi:L-asparaginase